MEKEENNLGESTGIIICLIGAFYFYALTLSLLWKWFIVPFGLIPITIAHSFGLLFFISIFRETKNVGDMTLTLSVEYLMKLLSILLFGYIVHQFM